MAEPQYKLEGIVHTRTEIMEDFEGPLDVIFLLLSKNKIEIQDVSITAILEQYLAYLDEMKRLGVYDDASVVMTGDQPWAVDDHVEPTQPRLTALFVKEAGAAEKPLRVSTAQVSQENLIPTLVKSAGLRTDRSFGTAYSEVPEGVDTERHHLFALTYGNGYSALVDFRVCGKGRDFANWQVDSRTDIGWLYK